MSDEQIVGEDITPEKICLSILSRISSFLEIVHERLGIDRHKFDITVQNISKENDGLNEKFQDELTWWSKDIKDISTNNIVHTAYRACVYATRGSKEKNVTRAWQHAARAQYWAGIFIGAETMRSRAAREDAARKAFLKIASDARHKDDRLDRKFVTQHYIENKGKPGYESKNEAADTMAKGRFVKLKYSTIRKIITGL